MSFIGFMYLFHFSIIFHFIVAFHLFIAYAYSICSFNLIIMFRRGGFFGFVWGGVPVLMDIKVICFYVSNKKKVKSELKKVKASEEVNMNRPVRGAIDSVQKKVTNVYPPFLYYRF